jgi:hypothetical protein
MLTQLLLCIVLLSRHSADPAPGTGTSGIKINRAALLQDAALLSIGYPLGKNDTRYNVFINRKKVARINPGERVIIQIVQDASYLVCISDKSVYTEPSTQAPNSRTISMKAGKQYFFMIGNGDQLSYMFNAENGAKAFNKTADFKDPNPAIITASQTGEIPSL